VTRASQDEDEKRWVTMMTELCGFTVRVAPEKQRELPGLRRADVAMVIVEHGFDKRIAVEVVEAMDETIRGTYSALRRLTSQVNDALTVRRFNARGLAPRRRSGVEEPERPHMDQRHAVAQPRRNTRLHGRGRETGSCPSRDQ
jgi:hypothetical protein